MSLLKAIQLSSVLIARNSSYKLTTFSFRGPRAPIHWPHTTRCSLHVQCSSSACNSPTSEEAAVQSCNFTDIENYLKAPSPSRVLIDVREARELHDTGIIPGSLNIPLISAPDAFIISPDEFRDRFGFRRPEKDVELIFYCRSGVRSLKAADLALKAGWPCVVNYSGSWLDWEERGGKKKYLR